MRIGIAPLIGACRDKGNIRSMQQGHIKAKASTYVSRTIERRQKITTAKQFFKRKNFDGVLSVGMCSLCTLLPAVVGSIINYVSRSRPDSSLNDFWGNFLIKNLLCLTTYQAAAFGCHILEPVAFGCRKLWVQDIPHTICRDNFTQ